MTKEQERAELHRAIWQIANDLRGSVDGWDFKQYVLGMLKRSLDPVNGFIVLLFIIIILLFKVACLIMDNSIYLPK